jgi:hypothetical protein
MPVKAKRKAWYMLKIEELEEKIRIYEEITKDDPNAFEDFSLDMSDEAFNQAYAHGFFDCMAKYGILTKLQRRRMKERIELEGPGSVKRMRRSKFSFPTPSI